MKKGRVLGQNESEDNNIALVCDDCNKQRKNEVQATLKKELPHASHCKIAFYDQDKVEHMWVKINYIDFETETVTGVVANEPCVVRTVKFMQGVSLFFTEIEDLYKEEW